MRMLALNGNIYQSREANETVWDGEINKIFAARFIYYLTISTELIFMLSSFL